MLTFIFVPDRLKFWWIRTCKNWLIFAFHRWCLFYVQQLVTSTKRLSFTKSYLVLDSTVYRLPGADLYLAKCDFYFGSRTVLHVLYFSPRLEWCLADARHFIIFIWSSFQETLWKQWIQTLDSQGSRNLLFPKLWLNFNLNYSSLGAGRSHQIWGGSWWNHSWCQQTTW
jgi:hypothetical protein